LWTVIFVPKPIKSHVKRVLAKNGRAQKLLNAIHFGWETGKTYPRYTQWRRKTTRAHVVWEETVEKAEELLADDDGVKIIPHHDNVSFIFDDTVLLRFKKASVTLRSSNVQTVLSDLFHEHRADLFGYGGLQRVEACHVLNPFETGIVWVGIVARESNAHLWHFELEAERGEATILPFPERPKGSTAGLAKVKKDQTPDTKEEKKDGD
jgi:hypothetical protein